MGNSVKKASNINEFKKLVYNTSSLINSKSKQNVNSNIYLALSIDIPDNELVTETILWKLFVSVLIIVYNKTEDGDYSGKKPIVKTSLTFDEFYLFLNNIQSYFDAQNKKDGNIKIEATATKDEDDNLCPICLDNEATNLSSECFHAFCDKCINEWRKRGNNECPLCRNEHNNDKSDFVLVLENDLENRDPLLDHIKSILVFIKK